MARQPEKIVDVRVDDHPDPIAELERLASLAEAYYEHELGLALLGNDASLALKHWTRAAALAPDNQELCFWRAVALVATGSDNEARQLLGELSANYAGWQTLLALPAVSLLPSIPSWLAELRP